MSMTQSDVERTFEESSYKTILSTTKVTEYKSEKNGKIIYCYQQNGLSKITALYSHIRCVIHPAQDISALTAISGVEVNLMDEFHSNMLEFPSKIYKDEKPCHYGIGFNVKPEVLSDFLSAFHQLKGQKPSISQNDVEKMFEKSGFSQNLANQKIIEYKSNKNGKIVYLRLDHGLPRYMRVVVNPDEMPTKLVAIDGVEINEKNEFQHAGNMTAFPKRVNKGTAPIHYGRAFHINSVKTLGDFLTAFHKL